VSRRSSRGATAVAVLLIAASVTACTADAGDTSTPAEGVGVPDAALAVMNEDRYANSRWQIYAEDLETGDVVVKSHLG